MMKLRCHEGLIYQSDFQVFYKPISFSKSKISSLIRVLSGV
jgi:hypothetical protein